MKKSKLIFIFGLVFLASPITAKSFAEILLDKPLPPAFFNHENMEEEFLDSTITKLSDAGGNSGRSFGLLQTDAKQNLKAMFDIILLAQESDNPALAFLQNEAVKEFLDSIELKNTEDSFEALADSFEALADSLYAKTNSIGSELDNFYKQLFKLSDESYELSKQRAELSDQKTELSDQKTELSDQKTELSDQKTELSDQRTELLRERGDVALSGDTKIDELDQQIASLDQQIVPLKQKIASLDQKIETEKSKLNALEQLEIMVGELRNTNKTDDIYISALEAELVTEKGRKLINQWDAKQMAVIASNANRFVIETQVQVRYFDITAGEYKYRTGNLWGKMSPEQVSDTLLDNPALTSYIFSNVNQFGQPIMMTNFIGQNMEKFYNFDESGDILGMKSNLDVLGALFQYEADGYQQAKPELLKNENYDTANNRIEAFYNRRKKEVEIIRAQGFISEETAMDLTSQLDQHARQKLDSLKEFRN